MVSTAAEARRAAQAGADVVVAQGSEGGGHVGLIGTIALVPMVVRAVRAVRDVAPIPVLAAGGLATGSGLAAALALGADGALMGTRFLATEESPLPEGFQRAILASDGHNTLLTEIPDVARGRVWPGAFSRVARNRFIERWAAREGELRASQAEAAAGLQRAAAEGDAEEGVLFMLNLAGIVRVGLVSTAINEPEFDVATHTGDPTLIGAPKTLHLPRTLRSGVAVQPLAMLLVAIDYDLIETDTLIPDAKSRQLSAGVELKLPLFAIRAGAFHDSAAIDPHWAYSLGFGLGLKMLSVNASVVLSTEGGTSLSSSNRRDLGAALDARFRF